MIEPEKSENLANLSLEAARAALDARQCSAADLVEACLARIDQFEPVVRAWVLVDAESARREAAQRDAELQRNDLRGPLHGIPLGIKDIIDVAGWPTRAGSTLRPDVPARTDAPVVAKLRAAGAIFLGKTVTTEFASFDPSITRNPFDIHRTPGGSSSGSAAAVALGMCYGALGTQTGGSIIRPAGYCGVVGFKPTYGAASCEGVVPLSPFLDHVGCMARRAADAQLLFSVMADSPLTATTWNHNQPLRLATLDGYWLGGCAPRIQDTARNLAELSGGRITVEPITSSLDWAAIFADHRVIMAVEAAQIHYQLFMRRRHEFGPNVAALIEEGLQTPGEVYRGAMARRAERQATFERELDGCDGVVLPSTVGPAPDVSTTGDPRFNSPLSYLGVPCITLPACLADDGLPLGLQLAARRGDDLVLLHIATMVEGSLPLAARPTMLEPRA